MNWLQKNCQLLKGWSALKTIQSTKSTINQMVTNPLFLKSLKNSQEKRSSVFPWILTLELDELNEFVNSSPLSLTNERKEIISLFKEMKWINENIIVSIINEAIEEKNTMIDAIFKVYDQNKDKQDFAESIEIFGKQNLRSNSWKINKRENRKRFRQNPGRIQYYMG